MPLSDIAKYGPGVAQADRFGERDLSNSMAPAIGVRACLAIGDFQKPVNRNYSVDAAAEEDSPRLLG
jgi:hypothetical protein